MKTPLPTGRHQQGARKKPHIATGRIPPYLQFLNQAEGTLPEVINETNLETLNRGLSFLFALLRDARSRFEQEGDGGRSGAFTALGAIWMFIALFQKPYAEGLQVPILRLQDALASLDENRVLPILKPAPRAGRSKSSQAYLALKGHAVGTVERLRQKGFNSKEAYRLAADTLNKLGVKPERGSGRLTAVTIRNWCDEVASDVGRHGTPALTCDQMFGDDENRRLLTLPKNKARDFALASLARWVGSIFPEL